jgi:hypothetical protein
MDWLAREDANGNFLYNIDKYSPHALTKLMSQSATDGNL